MRIGLNLLHALPEIGGGWNYIESLISALARYGHEINYVAFVTQYSRELVPRQPNFEVVPIRLASTIRSLRVVYENTIFNLLLKRFQLDCIHWFSGTQSFHCHVPSVVTVHDLKVFIHGKDSMLQQVYLKWAIKVTARRASLLLPVSVTTQQELQKILSVAASRMAVIPAIIDDSFSTRSCDDIIDFRTKYCLPVHFWLYVAHFYPHKNHIRLLQAYHNLKSCGFKPWPLVLRGDPKGAETDVMRIISELDLKNDVIFLPRLDEAELPVLYSTASALIFPSTYEGGGIPVMEAMACGCPIVAADIPAVREFAGEAAICFDERNVLAIADAMKNLQENMGICGKNIQNGIDRIKKHRPKYVAERLVHMYRMVKAEHSNECRR